MKKNKMAYALPAVVIISCVGIFGISGNAFAYTEDTDGYAIPVGSTDAERYNDLKLAISDGKNVRLNDDISHYITVSGAPSITVNHTMTLDLNGHILSTASTSGGSAGNTAIAVSGEGTVFTIDDSSSEKNGAIRYDHKGNTAPTTLWINAGAKAVLKNGSIYSPYGRTSTNGEGIAVNMKGAGSVFEMSGGAIFSHEESTATSNYGVRFNSAGTFNMTGGKISTVGSSVASPNSNEAVINISSGVELASSKGKEIEITSAKTSGQIANVSVKNMSVAGAVNLNSVHVFGNLDVKSGERTIKDTFVDGKLTVSGGTTTISDSIIVGVATITAGNTTITDDTNMVGGVIYQSAATGVLTFANGAVVNGLTQLGKATTASYTDKDTKQKVSFSYDAYGALNINDGYFVGDLVLATPAQVEASNATRKEYVDSYNEHSGKTPIEYSDVASVPAITGGLFETEPNAEDIAEGYEPEKDDKTGYYEIVPIDVDWKDYKDLEKLYDGEYAVVVDIQSELFADHMASLNTSEFSDLSDFKLTNGGDLLTALDIDMVNRDNVSIEVKDNKLHIYIDLSEEDYNKLAAYDKVQIVYFDENGNESERLDAKLFGENGWYWIEFDTTHLSTYGVVGVNEESGSATPETGTMTAQGASAVNAAVVTSVAVGLLVSITSFVYLIRRR